MIQIPRLGGSNDANGNVEGVASKNALFGLAVTLYIAFVEKGRVENAATFHCRVGVVKYFGCFKATNWHCELFLSNFKNSTR